MVLEKNPRNEGLLSHLCGGKSITKQAVRLSTLFLNYF